MLRAAKGLGTALLALLPQAAVALSCVEYRITDTYWYHENSAETYLLVQGRFSDLTWVQGAALL